MFSLRGMGRGGLSFVIRQVTPNTAQTITVLIHSNRLAKRPTSSNGPSYSPSSESSFYG